MGAWMRCSRWLGGWATAFLLAVAPVAQASPVFGLSSASGFAGDTVSLTVSGDLDLFIASALTVNFDPLVLAFVGVTPTAYLVQPIVGAPGELELSIVSDNPGVTLGTGPSFSYFDLLFTILAGTPAGLSTVELLAGGLLFFQDPVDPLNPEREETLASGGLSGTVMVLANNDVPVPGTASLALAALGLLALSRRSRKALALAVPA